MPVANNALRQIKIILYRLKRNFGLKITVTRVATNTQDLQTGISTKTYTTMTIRRAIVLPAKTSRDFAYDLSYIAANKNFTYGGYFDPSMRVIIIDAADVKGTNSFVPNLNDIATFDSQDWNIKEITVAEHNRGYLMKVKRTASQS